MRKLCIAAMLVTVATAAAATDQPAPASQAAAPLASSAPERIAEAKQIIAMQEGTWDADITFPSQEAGKPDQKAKGVQVNSLRSGGMWMLNEFSVDGTPYQGTGIWGYDRLTGEYTGIWTDNNDHHIRTDKGRWLPQRKTMVWIADVPQADGSYLRLLFTEEDKGPGKREFKSVALTRKGEIPLVIIQFTKRAS